MRRVALLLVPVCAALGVVVPAAPAHANPLVQVTVTVNRPTPPPQSLVSVCLTVGANGPNCLGDQDLSPAGTGGVVVVRSWHLEAHAGYFLSLSDVHFAGSWQLGALPYQFVASTPGIGLGRDSGQWTVSPFALTGIGPAGSFAADCGPGSGALQPELFNAPQLGGLLTFSVPCTGTINGRTAGAFTLSVELVLPSQVTYLYPGAPTPVGGTVSNPPAVGKYGG